MIQATINNHVIESFLYEKFKGDKIQITAYINDFLNKYLPYVDNDFEEDRKKFHETYKRMQNGTMRMITDEEANREIDDFLKTL